MNIKEITKLIAAEGRNLLSDAAPAPDSMPKIYGVIGCPNPMSDDLVFKLRHLASKGATVVFLRDDEELTDFKKMAEIVLVDSLPVPNPSDFETISRKFHLKEESVLINPEIFDDSQREQCHFVPRKKRIPVNCRNFNRSIGLNRRIMKR